MQVDSLNPPGHQRSEAHLHEHYQLNTYKLICLTTYCGLKNIQGLSLFAHCHIVEFIVNI